MNRISSPNVPTVQTRNFEGSRRCCLSALHVVYCGCHVRLPANHSRVLQTHGVSSFYTPTTNQQSQVSHNKTGNQEVHSSK